MEIKPVLSLRAVEAAQGIQTSAAHMLHLGVCARVAPQLGVDPSAASRLPDRQSWRAIADELRCSWRMAQLSLMY
jgi:hypothetical protein